MRKANLLLLSVALVSFTAFYACEESGADDLIRLTPRPDVLSLTYVNADSASQVKKQQKNVLIEDFTGSSCPNCPDAAEKVKDAKDAYGERIVSMAIHAGAPVFVAPSDHSTYDFRTKDGDALFDLMGGGALPTGSVDRVKYSGESTINHDRFLWLEHARKRIEEASDIPMNIDIEVLELNEDKIQFAVRVFYHTDADVTAPEDKHYLSVYITEDSLIDYQKFPGPPDEEYVHNHVLRTLVSNNTNGDELDQSLVAGRLFVRRYTVDILKDDPDAEYLKGWTPKHLNVVAVVHKKTGDDYEVIHVRERKAE